MRPLAIILVLIAAAAAVWLLRAPPEDARAQPGSSGVEEPTSRGGSPDPACELGDSLERVEVATELDSPSVVGTEVEQSQASVDTAAANSVAVVGHIIVVDPDGVEHADLSGSFQPYFVVNEGGSGGRKLTVSEGRFEVRVPQGRKLKVSELVLNGRSVFLDQEIFDVSTGTVQIRGRWASVTVLRVVDSVSGADLSGVTVLRWQDWQKEAAIHPGTDPNAEPLAERKTSPITIENQHTWNEVRALVGAPEHAWQSVFLDFSVGGEHRVELEPGANLQVLLLGELPSTRVNGNDREAPEVRLRPDVEPKPPESLEDTIDRYDAFADWEFPDGVRPTEEEVRALHARQVELAVDAPAPAVLFDRARTGAPIEWRGLPAGAYVVSVELGKEWDDPLSLGTADVVLEAGTMTEVTIALKPPPEPVEEVPLAGTLRVPSAWERVRLGMNLELVDRVESSQSHEVEISEWSLKPVPGTEGLYRWDAGQVVPGRYVVDLSFAEFQTVIDTGPGGREDVRIELPAPADVTVQVKDAGTGLPVADVTLHWHCKRPLGSTGGGLSNARWDAQEQVYRFRAPATAVQLSLFDKNYAMDARAPELLEPGPNTIHLTVRRLSGIVLRVKEEGRTVPFPSVWFWDTKVKCLRGEGTGRPGISSNTEGTVTITKGGLYEITVAPLPGFLPIPPFLVEVPEAEQVDYVIEVTRSK